jgi:hypothetical protein
MAAGVEAVLAVLESSGFERLPSPLVVAGSAFEFDAAARGTVYSHDLVVVALTSNEPSRLVRLLSGLSLTLDQVASRRPVTLVLLGDPLDASTHSQLERQARVLAIGSEEPSEKEIREVVAILLPLDLPTSSSQGRDALAELEAVVGKGWSDEHRALVAAAAAGPDAVRDALREYLEDGASGVADLEAPM